MSDGLIDYSLNTYAELYQALRASTKKSSQAEWGDKRSDQSDTIDERVTQLFLSDFEASGVHLPPEKVNF